MKKVEINFNENDLLITGVKYGDAMKKAQTILETKVIPRNKSYKELVSIDKKEKTNNKF